MRPLPKVLLFVAFLALPAVNSPAGEQAKKSETRQTGTFQVRIDDGYLSLSADGAPLARIIQDIARQARITIDGNLGSEEKITTRIDHMPLEEGIKKLAKNVSVFYVRDTADSVRIQKIVILSEVRGGSAPSKEVSQPEGKDRARPPTNVGNPAPQPQPFKFEFDPAKSIRREKAAQQR